MKRYKVYENKGKYEIINVYGITIATCTNKPTANEVARLLEENTTITQDDIEIISRASELNNIKEPERNRDYKNLMPANDNSILNTPLAKATRELLGKNR